ncbi:hypothetical protein Tco_0267091 [Tanacetum coccineum]
MNEKGIDSSKNESVKEEDKEEEDSEIMEKKLVIARLNKVLSPDGDYLVIYKANGNFRAFNYLMEVLYIFDRQYLFHLYDLMREQYSEVTLDGYVLILWGDLKIMMESSIEGNEQSDADREVPVNETFHEQTDDELTEKELKQFRENVVQNVGHLVGQNVVQNQGTQNVRNKNRVEGHYASNCTVKTRKRDVAYLHIQLQITQKDEAGIQLNFEEFDFMAAVGAYDEIEKVTANYNLQDNLQQTSTSGTQTNKAHVYDSDGSTEVHHYDNCYNNDIFNVFTQKEQYTELLKPIFEPHQVQQNDINVIFAVSGMEQSGGTIEQHPANVEETRVLYDSLYNNLAIEVEKVNSVNRKLRETNADLTTELARYKNQEKCFEISQEKYDKLERCYQKSVYQEQCLTKKINALHLSSAKTITTLNEEIANFNKTLSKEKSTVSSLLEEKKKLKSDFKIREDELLDKQIQLENKIKELDNILVKTGQSIQTMHMLSPKPDSFYHTEQKMALGYQNPFYLKQAQQKQQSLYNDKVLLEKHDPPAVLKREEDNSV